MTDTLPATDAELAAYYGFEEPGDNALTAIPLATVELRVIAELVDHERREAAAGDYDPIAARLDSIVSRLLRAATVADTITGSQAEHAAQAPHSELVYQGPDSRVLKTEDDRDLELVVEYRDGDAWSTFGVYAVPVDDLERRAAIVTFALREADDAATYTRINAPCPTCSAEPGEPCNGEAHAAEAKAPVRHPQEGS